MKLADSIREGLKIKRTRREQPRKVEPIKEKPKAKPQVPVTPPPAIKPPAETAPTPPVEETAPTPAAEVKEEVKLEPTMLLIKKEIEELNFTVDEKNKVCRLGNLTTLDFKDLEGCNPVMVATKIKEAVKGVLLKKYQVKPDELENTLNGFKKKFKTFGVQCYVRGLKEKM